MKKSDKIGAILSIWKPYSIKTALPLTVIVVVWWFNIIICTVSMLLTEWNVSLSMTLICLVLIYSYNRAVIKDNIYNSFTQSIFCLYWTMPCIVWGCIIIDRIIR